SVTGSRFRDVMGHLAGGVAVVTSLGRDGTARGLTATAVCSVSMDPPLVLASVDRGSRTHGAIEASGFYAINLLSADQEELAVRFASKDPDKFRGLGVGAASTGAPVLEAGLAYLDCEVHREVAAGDHTLFVGRVEAAAVQGDDVGEPLIYHLGRYGTLAGE
ncbi:MAG: flavin reductase family protein, partial [Gemmatimonadota bacterium]